MPSNPPVIAIVGPTGTGKSELALDLAQKIGNCEIINADAFAQYRGMDIGTAKQLPHEQRGIPHHLIDVLDTLEVSTIAQYQQAARIAVSRVLARGATPIVVGGSGLYVRALLDEMALPGSDAAIRADFQRRLAAEGIESLYAELAANDGEAAAKIDPHNARRIIRALEVIAITGKPYAASLPSAKYVYPTSIQIGLDFARSALDERIEKRVAKMRAQHLLSEVRGLASPAQGGTGPGLGETAARAIGYAELLPVLRGEVGEAAAFEQIVANTRRLTRKQMGWFGRDPRITWLDGATPHLADNALTAIDQAICHPIAPSDQRAGVISPQRVPLGSISAMVSSMWIYPYI